MRAEILGQGRTRASAGDLFQPARHIDGAGDDGAVGRRLLRDAVAFPIVEEAVAAGGGRRRVLPAAEPPLVVVAQHGSSGRATTRRRPIGGATGQSLVKADRPLEDAPFHTDAPQHLPATVAQNRPTLAWTIAIAPLLPSPHAGCPLPR